MPLREISLRMRECDSGRLQLRRELQLRQRLPLPQRLRVCHQEVASRWSVRG